MCTFVLSKDPKLVQNVSIKDISIGERSKGLQTNNRYRTVNFSKLQPSRGAQEETSGMGNIDRPLAIISHVFKAKRFRNLDPTERTNKPQREL